MAGTAAVATWVFLIIFGATPDGLRVEAYPAGKYVTMESCRASWETFKVKAQVAKIPASEFAGACLQTNFPVKTAKPGSKATGA